jgi:hypothetical protein
MAYSETRFVPARGADVRAVLAGAVASAVLLIPAYLLVNSADTEYEPLTSAYVKVETVTGHGSATHIGDGLYVTAAHVVKDVATVKINGVESAVLWANSTYDIALISGPSQANVVPLACYDAAVGEVGDAHGNPLQFTDISTTLTVAGEAGTLSNWKLAMPMDGTMAAGMSGGGWVINGFLAGVNVGVAMAPTPVGLPSFFGISVVVPSSVVCDLMGRV